jgi:hypothetical protein
MSDESPTLGVIKAFQIHRHTLPAPALQAFRLQLEQMRQAKAQENLQERLATLVDEEPMTRIIVPLLLQRLRAKGSLHELEPTFKVLSDEAFKSRFHPRYARLRPGQRVEKKRLGKDILQAYNPKYRTKVSEGLKVAFGPQAPSYPWRRQGDLEAREGPEPVPLPPELVERLQAGDDLNLDDLAPGLSLEGGGAPPDLNTANANRIHHDLTRALRKPLDFVPDLNGRHWERVQHRYDIELDWFHCVKPNESKHYGPFETDDEPYWHISTQVPRYDPQDPEQMHRLLAGDLYALSYRLTDNYEVQRGSKVRFRNRDRRVLSAITHNTTTALTIGLWENDCSKGDVRDAISGQTKEVAEQLAKEIKAAVVEILIDQIMDELMELFPLAAKEILLFFRGAIDFETMMDKVNQAYGGIQLAWLLLEILIGGKSVELLLEGLGMGLGWEVYVALLALRVGGPIAYDLITGDFEGFLDGMARLPLTLLETLWDTVTNPFEFVRNLAALIDPDDQIAYRAILIGEAGEDPLTDAYWSGLRIDRTTRGPGGLSKSERWGKPLVIMSPPGSTRFPTGSTPPPPGCGPNANNSSLKVGGRYVQPELEFIGDDAHYNAYLNVKRTSVGGWETFGYTVKAKGGASKQTHTYKAKSSRRSTIKGSVVALNSKGTVPYVTLSCPTKRVSGSNMQTDDRGVSFLHEFEVRAYPGEEYTLEVRTNALLGDFYGYVTLEEEPRTLKPA